MNTDLHQQHYYSFFLAKIQLDVLCTIIEPSVALRLFRKRHA